MADLHSDANGTQVDELAVWSRTDRDADSSARTRTLYACRRSRDVLYAILSQTAFGLVCLDETPYSKETRGFVYTATEPALISRFAGPESNKSPE